MQLTLVRKVTNYGPRHEKVALAQHRAQSTSRKLLYEIGGAANNSENHCEVELSRVDASMHPYDDKVKWGVQGNVVSVHGCVVKRWSTGDIGTIQVLPHLRS